MSVDRRLHVRLVVILVVVGLIPILIWGIRVVKSVNNLKSSLDYIRNILAIDNPLDIDPGEIDDLLLSSRQNVIFLKRDMAFFEIISPFLTWIPKVGTFIGEVPDLLAFADIGTKTAIDLWTYASPTYQSIQDLGFDINAITRLISTLTSDVDTLQANASQLLSAYNAINADAIPWQYQELFQQLGPFLTLYDHGLIMLDDIPDLIGVDQPSTYLVLALNEDELRAGGGFITGAGELEMLDGKISSIDLGDSYSADDFSLPYPDSPSPLSQFMAIDLWVFRDSNWSPDFPSSAVQAIQLYRPVDPVTPVGVIALDQYAAEKIVDTVGPLRITGNDTPVTGETLVDYIRNAWAPENAEINVDWVWSRKSFMGDLTKAAMKKIESGAVDWTTLLQTGIQLIEQRHIQIYVDNEDARYFLKSLGWDSSLILPSHDSFLFVESNVGYNKASTRIDRMLSYDVNLTGLTPIVEVKLNLRHRSQNDTDCMPEVRFYPTYVQSMERCYWAYFRFFVPNGSQLIDASQHPIDAKHVLTGEAWPGIVNIVKADEGAVTVFEQAILLPTASSAELYLKYALPDTVIQMTEKNEYVYKLSLQKQAGLRMIPTNVRLRVPQNALISYVPPEAHEIEPGVFMYEIKLLKNEVIELHYSLPEKE